MSAAEELLIRWERDAEEYLHRFGQHMPCSLETCAEMLREALAKDVAA